MSRTIFFLGGDSYPVDERWEDAIAEVVAGEQSRFVRHSELHRHVAEGQTPSIATRLAILDEAIRSIGGGEEIFLVARSSGARTASLLAHRNRRVSAVACLSYPFRTPGTWLQPERFAHLATLRTPMLIVQGADDEYGGIALTEHYQLSETIRLRFVPGHHGLQPDTPSGRYVLGQIPTFLDDGWRDPGQNMAGFDEDYYLTAHPGIADAIAAGTCPSGVHHFQACGRREGKIYRMKVENTG